MSKPGTGRHGSNASQRRWLSMSKPHKNMRSGNTTTPPAGIRRGPVAAIILLAVAIGVPLGFGGWRAEHADTHLTVPSTPVTATRPLAPMAATAPGVQQLKGTWLRPDGGYVIEVRTVEDGGHMDVAYFNPRPIKVSQAEASQEGATTKVFLELRDVQYPGSTYTLRYDPASDQLQGVYYQAALQQHFDVVFVRMK
jgi:hypothetical protein